MGEARHPKGIAHLQGHRHHRTTEHQGCQDTAGLGATSLQQGLGHAPAQVGDRRCWLGQQGPLLDLQHAPDALAGQALRRAGQQGMGRRLGPSQRAAGPQAPALPQLWTGAEAQFTAPLTPLHRHPAAGAIEVGLGIAQQRADPFNGQPLVRSRRDEARRIASFRARSVA